MTAFAALLLGGCSIRDIPFFGNTQAETRPVGIPYSAERLAEDLSAADAAGNTSIDLVYDLPEGVTADMAEEDLSDLLGSYRYAFFDEDCRYGVSEDPGRVCITVRRTYNRFRDEKAAYLPGGDANLTYSEETLSAWLEEIIHEGGVKKSAMFLMDDPPSADTLSGMIETALSENEYARYYLSYYEVSVLRYTDAFYADLFLTRREGTAQEFVDLDTMSDEDFIRYLIDNNTTWEEKTAVHFTGTRDAEEISYLGEVAVANDPFDVSCPPDSRVTEEYAGKNGSIVVLWFEHPAGTEARDELRAPMQEAILSLYREIEAEAEGLGDADTFALIAQRITEAAEYDFDLADAIADDTLTPDMCYRESAYGALVDGMTVCSGYTAAFKAVCDLMGLPCFVIHGLTENHAGEEEMHAWCAVLCDGELRYIDPTYMDFNDTGEYFLFPDYESADGRTEDAGWVCPIG